MRSRSWAAVHSYRLSSFHSCFNRVSFCPAYICSGSSFHSASSLGIFSMYCRWSVILCLCLRKWFSCCELESVNDRAGATFFVWYLFSVFTIRVIFFRPVSYVVGTDYSGVEFFFFNQSSSAHFRSTLCFILLSNTTPFRRKSAFLLHHCCRYSSLVALVSIFRFCSHSIIFWSPSHLCDCVCRGSTKHTQFIQEWTVLPSTRSESALSADACCPCLEFLQWCHDFCAEACPFR